MSYGLSLSHRLTLACALAFVVGASAQACDMNVREAGFITNMGGPYYSRTYSLLCFAGGVTDDLRDDTKKLVEFAKANLEGLNLSIELVDAGKATGESRQMLADKGISLDKLPLSVFMRETAQGFDVVSSMQGRVDPATLTSMALSPKKAVLRQLLSSNDNYCVIVFVPGENEKTNLAALAEITAAITEHAAEKPTQKMPVVTVPRGEKDDFFLKEMGAMQGGKQPFAAILFGKARMLLPTLAGETIAKDPLLRAFAFLNHNASDCSDDPVDVPGSTVDLLIPWSDGLDRQMVMAVIKSGTIPDLNWETVSRMGFWDEAATDSRTGELIETPPPEDQNRVAAAASSRDAVGRTHARTMVAGAPARTGARAGTARLAATMGAATGLLAVVLIAGFVVLRRRRER